MEFQFSCKSCGSQLSAEEDMRGSEIECPVCQHEISVPSSKVNSYRPQHEEVIPTLRPPQKRAVSENREKRSTGNGSQKQQPSGKQLLRKKNNSKILTSPLSNKPAYQKKKSGGGGILAVVLILLVCCTGLFIYWKSGKTTEKIKPEVNAVSIPPIPEKPKVPEKKPIKKTEEKPAVKVEKESQTDYKFNTVDKKEIEGSNAGVCKVEYGNFDIEANLYRNKTVKVHYGIPLSEDGKPLSTASNVVFNCPFLPERKFLSKSYYQWFPEVAGYTFFSIDIVSDMEHSEDKTHEYTLIESGFHDLVFKIKKVLEKKYELEERKILLTGQSAGACMAEEFVIHYHDKIDVSACNGGYNNIRFKKQPTKHINTAYLINNTVGDWYSQKPKNHKFMQVLRGIPPPIWSKKDQAHFHHEASPVSWNLIHLFIKGVVELRAKHGGVLPYYEKWPYKRKNSKGQILYFPSEEFQNAWNTIPHDILEKLKYKPEITDKKNIYFIPGDKKTEAVVIYIHDPEEEKKDKSISMTDCLYYFMQQNVVACSVKITKDRNTSLKRVIKLLKEVMNKEEWKDLPIYVSGLGIGGEMAAVAALRYGERIEKKKISIKKKNVTIYKNKIIRHRRVKKIVAINSSFHGKDKFLSIKRSRSKSHIPLVMLYSSDFKKLKPKKIPDYTKIKNAGTTKYTLGKKWFETLKKIANGGDEI